MSKTMNPAPLVVRDFLLLIERGDPGTVDQTVPGLCEKRDKKMKRRD
jgi:hypothetical protein